MLESQRRVPKPKRYRSEALRNATCKTYCKEMGSCNTISPLCLSNGDIIIWDNLLHTLQFYEIGFFKLVDSDLTVGQRQFSGHHKRIGRASEATAFLWEAFNIVLEVRLFCRL